MLVDSDLSGGDDGRIVDVIFLVVDSLRAHPFADGRVARTPFLDSLAQRAVFFSRAYSTECWTLPSHASMFTGAMPSEHAAHFHTMSYRGAAPTTAEGLDARGYQTELVTRNFVFDGTIPGIARGFRKRTEILSPSVGADVTAMFLAATKPRFRRHLRNTGFFHALQHGDQRFLAKFAQSLQPADARLLSYLAGRAAHLRRDNRPFFLFANLYDVHAPYAPSPDSLLRPWRTLSGVRENVLTPYALSRLGEHRYLRRGFRMAASVREMLERRYRRSVELMDEKLNRFFGELASGSVFDDTVIILTSDHGEGFGEHGLYLHDASVFETHLRVPLWVFTPSGDRGVVDDVVSTRHLFGLVDSMVGGTGDDTILDPAFRARNPIAYAQHYHYPHVRDAMPIYQSNQFSMISKTRKVIRRSGGTEAYDLCFDPGEVCPEPVGWEDGLAWVGADAYRGRSIPPEQLAAAEEYGGIVAVA